MHISTINNEIIDISGITGKDFCVSTKNSFINESSNTDVSGSRKQECNVQCISNIPSYAGEIVEPKNYTEYIIEGFIYLYKIIFCNKNEFIKFIRTFIGKNDISIRYIFRDTTDYEILQDFINTREVLMEENFDLEKYIDCDYGLLNKKIVESELFDLLNGDIPYFTGNVKNKYIFNSQNEVCGELKTIPVNFLEAKIKCLSIENLDYQVGIIKTILNSDDCIVHDFNETKETEYSKNAMLKLSKLISDYIMLKSIYSTKTSTINWVNFEKEGNGYTIGPENDFLYNGICGNIVLFLNIYCITKDKKYKEFLYKLLDTIDYNIRNIRGKDVNVSAFNGIISYVYVYAMLYSLLEENKYIEMAISVLDRFSDEIILCDKYDVLDGLSGIILVLRSVYININKNDTEYCSIIKELCELLGERLCDNIIFENNSTIWCLSNEKIVSGFSHGLAGIIAALSALYDVLANEKYLYFIKKIINEENKFYDENENNWGVKDEFYVHWCHGATGIYMSRIYAKKIIIEKNHSKYNTLNIELIELLNCDVDRAKGVVYENGFELNNNCLCHGNLGNSEVITLDENCEIDDYEKLIFKIYTSEKFEQELSVNRSFGIMTGLSGIAYELLRLYDNEKVPCILLLET